MKVDLNDFKGLFTAGHFEKEVGYFSDVNNLYYDKGELFPLGYKSVSVIEDISDILDVKSCSFSGWSYDSDYSKNDYSTYSEIVTVTETKVLVGENEARIIPYPFSVNKAYIYNEDGFVYIYTNEGIYILYKHTVGNYDYVVIHKDHIKNYFKDETFISREEMSSILNKLRIKFFNGINDESIYGGVSDVPELSLQSNLIHRESKHVYGEWDWRSSILNSYRGYFRYFHSIKVEGQSYNSPVLRAYNNNPDEQTAWVVLNRSTEKISVPHAVYIKAYYVNGAIRFNNNSTDNIRTILNQSDKYFLVNVDADTQMSSYSIIKKIFEQTKDNPQYNNRIIIMGKGFENYINVCKTINGTSLDGAVNYSLNDLGNSFYLIPAALLFKEDNPLSPSELNNDLITTDENKFLLTGVLHNDKEIIVKDYGIVNYPFPVFSINVAGTISELIKSVSLWVSIQSSGSYSDYRRINTFPVKAQGTFLYPLLEDYSFISLGEKTGFIYESEDDEITNFSNSKIVINQNIRYLLDNNKLYHLFNLLEPNKKLQQRIEDTPITIDNFDSYLAVFRNTSVDLYYGLLTNNVLITQKVENINIEIDDKEDVYSISQNLFINSNEYLYRISSEGKEILNYQIKEDISKGKLLLHKERLYVFLTNYIYTYSFVNKGWWRYSINLENVIKFFIHNNNIYYFTSNGYYKLETIVNPDNSYFVTSIITGGISKSRIILEDVVIYGNIWMYKEKMDDLRNYFGIKLKVNSIGKSITKGELEISGNEEDSEFKKADNGNIEIKEFVIDIS